MAKFGFECKFHDPKATHAGQWIGLYVDEGEDPAFVLQCSIEFALWCMYQNCRFMPLNVKCYMVGTHLLLS